MLAEELGLDPGARLRALHERILRQEQEIPPGPRRPVALPTDTPRRRRMWAAAIALAALTAGALAVARTGDEPRTPAVRSGLLRIDPEAMRTSHTVAIPGAPSEVTAAGEQAWVLDADAQTISLVTGARQRTFATGSTPVDLAADGTDLLVAGGSPGSSQFRGPQAVSYTHLTLPTTPYV